MTWWIFSFFVYAILSRLLIRLPTGVWRVLFTLPFAVTFLEAVSSFLENKWLFPRDGLSDFFACIAMGIGFCVSTYAGAYFSREDAKKFFPTFFAFAGSMLGIIWIDNIFVIYTFWEATALCSFLLIAFHYKDPETRRSARQALLINSAGGLALLTSLLIMSQASGSTSLSEIITGHYDKFHGDYLLICLIVFAAATKSAQFPFHFWLPNAMKAPTPASCYLHSATMVKLGVFLLARFSPLFQDTTLWIVLLCTLGGITTLGALCISLLKTDLKQLFAWTTVSSLGSIFILIGIPNENSWKAFVSYIFAHSCYKASLFMCVGNIDKQIGTRSLYSITNLSRRMPMTSLAFILSLGSMIGLPFTLGFLGKEYLLTSALQIKGQAGFLIAVLVCSGALSIVVAYRILKLIFKKDPRPNRGLREARVSMWVPPLGLALAGWITNLFLNEINEYFLRPIVSSILLKGTNLEIEAWTGLNTSLLLSGVTFTLGGFLSYSLIRRLANVEIYIRFDYQQRKKKEILPEFSKKLTRILQNGKISSYLLWMFFPIGLWCSWMFLNSGFPQVDRYQEAPLSSFQWLCVTLIASGLIPLLLSPKHFLQIMGLSLVGYGIGLFFLLNGASDLAMTQMAVETVSMLILLFCLNALKNPPNVPPPSFQVIRSLFTVLSFFSMMWLMYVLNSGKTPSLISPFFAENAPTLGRGNNIVNVILVDFRALDTMGEVTVLSIVAFGAYLLLKPISKKEATFRSSQIVNVATSFFILIFSVVSVFILFRGHNSPGGGFVGGLIYGIALVFYALVFGEASTKKYLLGSSLSWLCVGLTVCAVSGALPLLHTLPPFTSVWLPFGKALGTPVLFDIGVYCVVVGVTTSICSALSGRASA